MIPSTPSLSIALAGLASKLRIVKKTSTTPYTWDIAQIKGGKEGGKNSYERRVDEKKKKKKSGIKGLIGNNFQLDCLCYPPQPC